MYSIYKESERDDILLVHIFYIFQCSASMKKDVSFVTFVGEELLALLMTNEQFFFQWTWSTARSYHDKYIL